MLSSLVSQKGISLRYLDLARYLTRPETRRGYLPFHPLRFRISYHQANKQKDASKCPITSKHVHSSRRRVPQAPLTNSDT
jgi:hypothetical protein